MIVIAKKEKHQIHSDAFLDTAYFVAYQTTRFKYLRFNEPSYYMDSISLKN